MVSTQTLHDEGVLEATTLPGKVTVEATPEASLAVNDVVDRIDDEDQRIDAAVEEVVVEESPRIDVAADETAVEEDVAGEQGTDMTDDDAQDILDRYGFGAGMRMYARSLALAELEEKERAAKAKAAAEFKAEKEALIRAKEEIATNIPPPKVLPSVTSVIDFETVRSELSKVVQSIASLGSMDYLSQSKNTKNENDVALASANNDNDDEDDVVEDANGAPRDEARTAGQGCCGAEEALNEIFREAEVWAEATYKNMSVDTASSSTTTQRSLKKSWWSALMNLRKGANQVTENLCLDQGSDKATVSSAEKKNWWNSFFCEPVILDEHIETAKPITTSPVPAEK